MIKARIFNQSLSNTDRTTFLDIHSRVLHNCKKFRSVQEVMDINLCMEQNGRLIIVNYSAGDWKNWWTEETNEPEKENKYDSEPCWKNWWTDQTNVTEKENKYDSEDSC